ncbi:MAG: beta-propeller fold lactonase family protein, partial [Candidatus Thiodiazotropha sp.]
MPKSAGQTFTLLIVAGLLTALAGCGGGGGGGGGGSTPPPTSSTPVARFAYVANTGDNTVSVYLADNTTGSLRHHGYAMTGDGPTSLTIDPSGQFAYTLNSNSQDISLFTIDSLAGTLTAADCDAVSNTSCGTGGTPVSLVFGSNGSFAYVANQVSNRITVHQKDPSIGALGDVNSVQPPVDDTTGGSLNPVKLSLHPSGDFLYAVHDTTSDVTLYAINSLDGTLSSVTGSPVASGGSGAIDIAITPDGNFAYVANSTSGDIGLFTVDGSGLLVPNTTSALLTTGLTPQALAVDPTGQWLYMISKQAPGSVSLFQIQSDGTLVQSNCGGSQTCATGNMPASIAIDPTGQFVSVTNESDNTVSLFSINQNNGQLT